MKRPLSARFWSVLLGLIAAVLLTSCAQNSPVSGTADAASGQPAAFASTRAAQDEAPAEAASSRSEKQRARQSARLGTQWGEGIDSHARTVALERISETPLSVTQIDYSARRHRGRAINEAMLANGRVGLSILNERNGKWSLTQNGRQIYLRGRDGERYQLFYRNYANRTYEIVATVDGLDVINGSTGSIDNRGYVLKPHDTLLIEGFRKNKDEVAAFRFSAVQDSYAANTPAGSPKNAGVIGTAVFELATPRAHARRTPADSPQAFPGDRDGNGNNDNNYAPPPDYDE